MVSAQPSAQHSKMDGKKKGRRGKYRGREGQEREGEIENKGQRGETGQVIEGERKKEREGVRARERGGRKKAENSGRWREGKIECASVSAYQSSHLQDVQLLSSMYGMTNTTGILCLSLGDVKLHQSVNQSINQSVKQTGYLIGS